MKTSTLILSILLFFSCDNSNGQMLGTSNYNREIINTENFIAYIQNPNSNSIAPMRSQEIFLVNSLSGKQIQLTNDRFSDSDLSWSPDGDRLLICSRRLNNRMARQHDNRNQAFLFIYNFLTGKELSLEENISNEVDVIGKKYKDDGFEVEKDSHYKPNSAYPFWIAKNRLGFKRYIYFGKSYGYGEFCSTDTLGKNLILHRKIFEKRKWKTTRSYWLNSDSIIVECSSFASYEPSKFKLYVTSKNEYVDYLPDLFYPTSISQDKTKLICFTDNSYVLYDLKTGEDEILFHDSKNISSVILSPFNDKIAFVKTVEYDSDIFIMNLESKEIRQITFDGGQKYSLSWSPKKAL